MAELVKEGYLEVKTGSVFGSKYKKNYIRLFKGIPAVQGASSRRKKLTSKSSTPTVQITDGEIGGSVHTVPLERAWSVAEKQSKSSKRWTFELHYDGVVIATFACSNMFEREEWLKAFDGLKLQSRFNPMTQETYKAVVLRSEGASELGISGEYMLSVGDGALLLKTASGFEVQRWTHTQVRRLAKCPDTPGKLLLDIAHPAGGALSFQFSVDDSSLQRLQKDWHALLVDQCDVDRLGQVLALLNSEPETLSLPDTDSDILRSRSSSLQSKPAGDSRPSGPPSQELLRFNSLRLPSTASSRPPVPQRSRLSLFISAFKEESLTRGEEEEEVKGAGAMESSTTPALPPKAPDRMQHPVGRGGEGEAVSGASFRLATQHQYLQVLPDDDDDVKTPPTEVCPPAMQGGEGYRDHTYLPLVPDEDNSFAPLHQPDQRHSSAFGRRSLVIPDSHMYDTSPPAPVYCSSSNPVQKKVTADKQSTSSGDDSAIDVITPRNSSLEPIVEDIPPHSTRDIPPHSTRETSPYPTRETTPYPTRETTPYPTRETTPYPTSSPGQSLPHPRDIPLKQSAIPVMSLDSSPKQHRVPSGVWAAHTVSHDDKSLDAVSHDSVSHDLPSRSGRQEKAVEHLQDADVDPTSMTQLAPLQTHPPREGTDGGHQPAQCSGLPGCSCAHCQQVVGMDPTPPPLPPRDDPPYYNIGARAFDGPGSDSPPLPPRPPKPRLSRESSTGSSKGKPHHHCSCTRKHSHERLLERMSSSELVGRSGAIQQSSGGGANPGVQQSSGGWAHPGVQLSSGGGANPGVQQRSGGGANPGVQQRSGGGAHPGVQQNSEGGAHPEVQLSSGVQQSSGGGAHSGVQRNSEGGAHPEVQLSSGGEAPARMHLSTEGGTHPGVQHWPKTPQQEAAYCETDAVSYSSQTLTTNSLTILPTSIPEAVHQLSEPVQGLRYRLQGAATSLPGLATVTSSMVTSDGTSCQPRTPPPLQSNRNDILPSAANATAPPPVNQLASTSDDGEAALQEALDSLQNSLDYMCLKYDTTNDLEEAEEVLMSGANRSAVATPLHNTDSEPHLLTESTPPHADPRHSSVETNTVWQTNPTFANPLSVAGAAPVHLPSPPLEQPTPLLYNHSSSTYFDPTPCTTTRVPTLYTREENVQSQFPLMGPSPAHLPSTVAVRAPATEALHTPFTADQTVPYYLSSLGLSPTHPLSMGLSPAHLSSVGLSPAHASSMGLSPSHPLSMGLPPAHPSSVGLSPAHPSSLGHSPAHPSSVGLPPSHPSSMGLPPAHPSSMGLPPAHPSSMGLSPAHPSSVGLSPAHPSSVGLSPAHPSSMGLSPAHASSMGLSPAHASSVDIILAPSTSTGSVPSCLSISGGTLPIYPATAHVTTHSLTLQSLAAAHASSIVTPSLSETSPSTHHRHLDREAEGDGDSRPEPEPYLNPVATPTETKPLLPTSTSVRKHAPLKRVAGENPRTTISSHPPRSMLNGDALLREMNRRVKRFDSQTSQNSDLSISSDGRSVPSTRSPRSSGRKHRSPSDGQMQIVGKGVPAAPPPIPPRHIPPPRSRTSLGQAEVEGYCSRPPLKPQDTTQSLDSALLSQALARAAPHTSAGLLDELAERVAMKMGAGVGPMPDMAPVQVTHMPVRHHIQPRH